MAQKQRQGQMTATEQTSNDEQGQLNEMVAPVAELFRELDFFEQNECLKELLRIHAGEANSLPGKMIQRLNVAMQDITSGLGSSRNAEKMYCENCDDNFESDDVVFDRDGAPICPNCKSALIAMGGQQTAGSQRGQQSPRKQRGRPAGKQSKQRGKQSGAQRSKQNGNQADGRQNRVTLKQAIHQILKPNMSIQDVEDAVFKKTEYQSKAEKPHVLISKNLSVMAQEGEIVQEGNGTYSPLQNTANAGRNQLQRT
jgi:uncharacterized protein YeeX (DUF496 family)